MSKVVKINYAEGYEAEDTLVRGLLVSIDGEEHSFRLSDDLKSTMKQFSKLQSKGYKLIFSENHVRVNPDDFIQIKREYRD